MVAVFHLGSREAMRTGDLAWPRRVNDHNVNGQETMVAKLTASSSLACPWGNTVRTGPDCQGSQDWPLPSSDQSWVVAASKEELSVEWVTAAAVQVAELRAVMAGAASRSRSSSAQ